MDDLIKKYNLQEAQKRFQQICEYRFDTSIKSEADDNMQQPDPNQQGQQQPPMGGGMPPTGNDPNMGGGQPPMNGGMGADPNMGGGMPPMDDGMDGDPGMGGQTPMDPNMSGDPNMDGGMPPMGEGPNMGGDPGMGADPMGDPDMDGMDQMQPDDEVIDVDQLTQSQETTEYKVDGVNDKLTALMNVLPKFIDALNQNDAKLEDLKAEIEKRNPTAEEKMNIRSQASYPYSETPKGYWERKMAEDPHYNVIYDNDVSPNDEQEEYVLRKGDISRDNDKDIAKSFAYPQQLKDILEF